MDEALFEVLKILKLMKKVDARMDYSFRTRLETWNHIKLTDRAFSCLPTVDRFNWSASGRVFGEVTAVGMSRTSSEQNYIDKTDFETRRENQDFGRQNISMSRPPLDSTPFDSNTINGTTSPI